MFNSLNNKPEDVTRAVVETAKLAEKLKAKKDKLVIKTYIEDDECKTECGQCFICRMAIRQAERKRNLKI